MAKKDNKRKSKSGSKSSKASKSKSKKTKVNKAEEGYCGAGAVPRGKYRASAEYCVQRNQVRYYGLKKIDAELLEKKVKTSDIDKERIKLKKIDLDADDLIKEFAKVKRILEDPTSTKSQLKQANAKKKAIFKRRDLIKKRFIAQTKVIKELEKKEAHQKHKEKNKSKSSKSKSSSKSSSSSKSKSRK